MPHPAADLARRLASEAEAVCRHYLSNGRRAGRYWLVGDVANTPGRSLFVRLHGSDCGVGAAGKWTDAATGSARRSSRSDRPESRPDPLRRRPRRGAGLPSPATRHQRIRRMSAGRQVSALPMRDVQFDRPTPRKPPAACSPCRSRSMARSPNAISATAASPSCPVPRACDFIRAATIGATRRREPRSGRR